MPIPAQSADGNASDGDDSSAAGDGPRARRHTEPAPRTAELVALLRDRKRLLILTHNHPDPDSLGAGFGLGVLAQHLGLDYRFAVSGRIMRAENQEMVRLLGIQTMPLDQVDPAQFDCVAVVDSQPGFGHTVIPENCCVDIVVDHHVATGSVECGKEPFRDVNESVGSTSTLVTHYLLQSGAEIPPEVATALLYGIKTDTADLSRNMSSWDDEAHEKLNALVDRAKLAAITKPQLPEEYFKVLREALNNVRLYANIAICSLGRISSPEMVAEVADLLLRNKDSDAVFVGGLVGSTYYVSVRTEVGGRHAWPLLRDALGGEGSFGGHGSVAGGCVPLSDSEDRTWRRLERRFEKNILRSLKMDSVTVHSLD